MPWRTLTEPMFPWVRTLDRILTAERPSSTRGEILHIASDYGGTDSRFAYRVDAFVCADLGHSIEWEMKRRAVRRMHLGDGRRMSYKGLGDRQRADALLPFLEAARSISGVCLAFITRKPLPYLCLPAAEFERFKREIGLVANWKNDALNDALRIAHIVSCLVAGLSRRRQNIYWVSDEDNVLSNAARHADVANIVSRFSSHYVKHELGELGIGTTKIDEGDNLEEDLASVADLVAGGVAEVVARLLERCGRRIPSGVSVEQSGPIKPKASRIADWFWSPGGSLRRVAILVERMNRDQLTVSRLDMHTL